MLDGDTVKRLKGMNDAQLARFLSYWEPAASIRSIGGLINPRRNLLLDDLTALVVDSWRDRHVPLDPRSVRYDWELDRREEVLAEASSLAVSPCEGLVVKAHEVVKEFPLLRKKEILVVSFVKGAHAFFGVAASRREVGNVRVVDEGHVS